MRDSTFQEPTRPIILNKSKKPRTEESLAWKMIVRRIEEKDTFVREFFFFFFGGSSTESPTIPNPKNEGRGLLPINLVTARSTRMGLVLRPVKSVTCILGPHRAGAGA